MHPQSTSLLAPSQVEYRDIPGFPGYRVGSDGTVWSNHPRGFSLDDSWHSLAGGFDKDGYRKVILCRPDGRRYARVNVLVLEVFVGPCPPGLVSCHDNGARADNRLENLRWDTQKNNIADKAKHGTDQRGDRSSTRKVSDAQVAEIRRRLAAGERGVDLAAEFGVSRPTISAIKVGRNWKHTAGAEKAPEVLLVNGPADPAPNGGGPDAT